MLKLPTSLSPSHGPKPSSPKATPPASSIAPSVVSVSSGDPDTTESISSQQHQVMGVDVQSISDRWQDKIVTLAKQYGSDTNVGEYLKAIADRLSRPMHIHYGELARLIRRLVEETIIGMAISKGVDLTSQPAPKHYVSSLDYLESTNVISGEDRLKISGGKLVIDKLVHTMGHGKELLFYSRHQGDISA